MNATITPSGTLKKRRRRFGEDLAVILTAVATLCIVLPVVAIIVILIAQGGRALSVEFLTAMPRNNMLAGGIMRSIQPDIGFTHEALPLGALGAEEGGELRGRIGLGRQVARLQRLLEGGVHHDLVEQRRKPVQSS